MLARVEAMADPDKLLALSVEKQWATDPKPIGCQVAITLILFFLESWVLLLLLKLKAEPSLAS